MVDEEREFQSKLLTLCENELLASIGNHPDSFSSKYQVVCCHTFKQTIKSIQKDNEIDVIILDGSFTKDNPDAMKQFLSSNTMGQVEVVILLNDMSEDHENNVHSLGIHYLIEKGYADLYLQQLIPLIINKKRNLTYINRYDNIPA